MNIEYIKDTSTVYTERILSNRGICKLLDGKERTMKSNTEELQMQRK
jgi:hypothetical protein